jgi:WD40 repeat protein
MAFSPNGRYLALGSGQFDRTVANSVNIDAESKLILVDVESRRPFGELRRPWPVFGVAFSPDSKRLASADGLGSVQVWSIGMELWRETACSTANRNLSRKEWQQLVGDSTAFRLVCPGLPGVSN